MADYDKQALQDQCNQFLQQLPRGGFLLLGIQKEDGTIDVVQTLKDMNPVAYVKGVSWALNDVASKM
jgi:hypothetical protein